LLVLFLKSTSLMNHAIIFFRFLTVMSFLFLSACNNSGNEPVSSQNGIYADTTYQRQSVSNTRRGQEIFRQRCEKCHGLNGNYRNNNAADLQLSRLDSIGIVTTIINGRGAMPMFDHSIPDSDLSEVEQYVKTLRKY
jgi:mono/diheme cytochrome c family protein